MDESLEGARRQMAYEEMSAEGPSQIAQNIKQMLEKSAAEDLPPSPLPEEHAPQTQVIFLLHVTFLHVTFFHYKKRNSECSACIG